MDRCADNCVVHLHSAAGKDWFLRRMYPFKEKKADMESITGCVVDNILFILPASSNTPQYQSQVSDAAAAAGAHALFFIERPVLATFSSRLHLILRSLFWHSLNHLIPSSHEPHLSPHHYYPFHLLLLLMPAWDQSFFALAPLIPMGFH